MKKIFIPLLFFYFGVATFAQGPLRFQNLTNRIIKVQLSAYTTGTSSACNATYYTALSATTPFTLSIPANATYILNNYNTFTPATLVNKWSKITNNLGNGSIFPNQMVGSPTWTVAKFQVLNTNGIGTFCASGVGYAGPLVNGVYVGNCSGYSQSYTGPNGVNGLPFSVAWVTGATTLVIFSE